MQQENRHRFVRRSKTEDAANVIILVGGAVAPYVVGFLVVVASMVGGEWLPIPKSKVDSFVVAFVALLTIPCMMVALWVMAKVIKSYVDLETGEIAPKRDASGKFTTHNKPGNKQEVWVRVDKTAVNYALREDGE